MCFAAATRMRILPTLGGSGNPRGEKLHTGNNSQSQDNAAPSDRQVLVNQDGDRSRHFLSLPANISRLFVHLRKLPECSAIADSEL